MHRAVTRADGDDGGVQEPDVELLADGVEDGAHQLRQLAHGAGLSVRQWAGDGVIEGICHTALPILAVQWHPERLRTGADGLTQYAVVTPKAAVTSLTQVFLITDFDVVE